MSEATPLTPEVAAALIGQSNYVVVMYPDEGDTRIVLPADISAYVQTGWRGYSPEQFVKTKWVITARSDDLNQLRAMCRLVGKEIDGLTSSPFLYKYLPSRS